MSAPSPDETIAVAVLGWPGVEAAPHRFGGTEFRLGRRELGHLHGSRVADLPLPRHLRDELIASGRAQVHRWRPDSGWVTIPLTSEQAATEVIELLRGAYERAQRARGRRGPQAAAG
jgi:Luciferase